MTHVGQEFYFRQSDSPKTITSSQQIMNSKGLGQNAHHNLTCSMTEEKNK